MLAPTSNTVNCLFPPSSPATFSEHSVHIQGTFSAHSENIQCTFREHSEHIQGTFREHSGNIQSTRAVPPQAAQRLEREQPNVGSHVKHHELLVPAVLACKQPTLSFREHSVHIQGNIQCTFRGTFNTRSGEHSVHIQGTLHCQGREEKETLIKGGIRC
jgi:hypothetical protein